MRKWSPILHTSAVIVVALGILALLGAWLAGEEGRTLGLSQEHLFSDAIALFLLGISLQLGTLVHRDIERHGE